MKLLKKYKLFSLVALFIAVPFFCFNAISHSNNKTFLMNAINENTASFKSGEIIYFKPGNWHKPNSVYKATFFKDDFYDTVDFIYTKTDSSSHGIFMVTVPDEQTSYDSIKFERHTFGIEPCYSLKIERENPSQNYLSSTDFLNDGWNNWPLVNSYDNNGQHHDDVLAIWKEVGKLVNVFADTCGHWREANQGFRIIYDLFGETFKSKNVSDYHDYEAKDQSDLYIKRFLIPIKALNSNLKFMPFQDGSDMIGFDQAPSFVFNESVPTKLIVFDYKENLAKVDLDKKADGTVHDITTGGTTKLNNNFAKDLFEGLNPCASEGINSLKYLNTLKSTYHLSNDTITRNSLSEVILSDIDINGLSNYTALQKLTFMEEEFIRLGLKSNSVINLSKNKKTVVIAASSVGGIAVLGCFGLFLKKRKFN